MSAEKRNTLYRVVASDTPQPGPGDRGFVVNKNGEPPSHEKACAVAEKMFKEFDGKRFVFVQHDNWYLNPGGWRTFVTFSPAHYTDPQMAASRASARKVVEDHHARKAEAKARGKKK